tara:strand:+ start:439 stop:1134 length:696 start_codon:yes stop_codon:yes gene_type:complete
MGKRIISQARGKGSLTYRVRKTAFSRKIKYPQLSGEAEIIALEHSAGHSAPLIKIKIDNETFYNAAFDGAVVGSKISMGTDEVKPGNIVALKDIPAGTKIYNIELRPGDGGKMIRVAGSNALINKKYEKKVGILTPKKKEVKLSGECRATIGRIAGHGRILKPFVKAGRKYHKMKARGKLYPRTSAVKMNAVDHPFGSGRGKVVKPKTPKRNAPRGRRVGSISPRRTGKKK